jgi:predicted porin
LNKPSLIPKQYNHFVLIFEVHMKKTIVALAALAALGTASAQATVYGKVDLGVSSTTATGAVNQGLEVTSGNYEGSRFGVRGSHDLTGGLKVDGHYQFRVDAAGNNSTVQDTRVATLGISGGFGSLTAGLNWTPYDSAWGFDQLEYNGFSAANQSWYRGAHGDNGTTGWGTAKKSIAYSTPDMNGFNATVMYANDADKTATADSVPYLGLGANYATGPLSLNFGYEKIASTVHLTTDASAGEETTAMVMGASYNLGVATVGVGYQQANVDAKGAEWKDAGFSLSVSAPVSANTTVALGYATETTTTAGKSDGKSTGIGAQAIYNWTKQAAIYAGVTQRNVKTAGSTNEVKTSKFATGLRYNF